MSEEKDKEFTAPFVLRKDDNVIPFAERVANRMKADAEKRKKEYLQSIELEEVGNNLFSHMDDEKAEIALIHRAFFTMQNDLSMDDEWEGFTSCGYYDLNNFPIIERKNEDDEPYWFALSPEFFSDILQIYAEGKADGDKMFHAAWIGQKYDAFVVKNPGMEGPTYETFYNSQLLEVSVEQTIQEEHSGFYPGLNIELRRPKSILVAWTDRFGEQCLDVLEGDWARYFLQGYEQTRGRPFWKNADDISLAKAKEKRGQMLMGLEQGELK